MHIKSTVIGSFTESLFSKQQNTMSSNINWDRFSHILSASCFFISLAITLFVLNANGISQIGFNEESIGYRYFHSLRLLYGEHEFPWLPQGQLIGLIHMLV